MGTRKMFALFSTVLLAAFALVGCGGDGDGPTDVNEPPSASISSPSDGASVEVGTEVTFEGSAEDPEDGALTGSALVWESDLDGQIGTGETVTTSELSAGDHQVTLTATDSDGASGTASVTLTVTNESPSATIDSPSDGATFEEGQEVTFEGSAEDPEDGTLTGDALVWESDVDGQLGTGETVVTSDLTPARHEITLTATDSDGASAQATVSITVMGPPSAQIASPADGATFDEGEEITFEGSATDPDDGDLTGDALVWESDLDGQIGTGQTFGRSDLSTGDHTITLTATDSDGNTAQATVSITVEQMAESITVSPGLLRVDAGGTGSLSVEVTDGNGDPISDPDLSSESRDPSVATITDTTVTAQSTGVTDVVVTAAGQISDSSRVAVLDPDGWAMLVSGNADDIFTSAGSGTMVTLQFRIQQPPGGTGSIGSLQGSLTWDPAQLTFEGGASTADGWSWTPNTNNVDDGELSFAAFKAEGETQGFVLREFTFTVDAMAGALAALDLTIDVAGDAVGNDITNIVEEVDTGVEAQ